MHFFGLYYTIILQCLVQKKHKEGKSSGLILLIHISLVHVSSQAYYFMHLSSFFYLNEAPSYTATQKADTAFNFEYFNFYVTNVEITYSGPNHGISPV